MESAVLIRARSARVAAHPAAAARSHIQPHRRAARLSGKAWWGRVSRLPRTYGVLPPRRSEPRRIVCPGAARVDLTAAQPHRRRFPVRAPILSRMGMLTRMLIPRGVRRAVHPARAVRRAVTPRTVRQVRRSLNPIDNAVYGVQRSLNTKPRVRRSGRRRSGGRRSGGGRSALLGILGVLVVVVLVWYALAWPWIVATNVAKSRGYTKGSATYNVAGWTSEVLYLSALLAIATTVTLYVVHRRDGHTRTVEQAPLPSWGHPPPPSWRHAPLDPPGLLRWWDGRHFTTQTWWDASQESGALPARRWVIRRAGDGVEGVS